MINYFTSSDQTFPVRAGQPLAGINHVSILDVDGDGKLDLLLQYLLPMAGSTGVPVRVLLGNGAGVFVDGPATLFGGNAPRTLFPVAAVIFDANGDGKEDIYLVDNGYEAPATGGFQNSLLVSSATGLTNATVMVAGMLDATNSASAADIDGDGDFDLYVGNGYGAVEGPYLLINNGPLGFTKNYSNLPAGVATESLGEFGTSTFLDADNDGDADLFLGYSANARIPNAGGVILINNGAGAFAVGRATPLVATDKTYVALHSESGDLNGDGVADLVVTWAASDFSVGRVQVLFGDKAGGFKDATSLSFPVASFADWVREATLADINNDGALDILVGRGTNTPIFLNDGYGRFVNLPDTLPLSQYFVAQAKDINGDGRTDLVYDVQLMYDPVFGNQERLTVLTGRDGGLVQTGDAGANGLLGDGDSEIFLGLGGDDVIFAAGGNDTLTGGAGNDYLHGGTGVDTAVYSGARSAYGLHFSTATGWSITDRRGGSPDGTDRLVSIETLQFSDGVYALSTLALGLDTAVANMLRLSNGVNLTRVSAEIDISLAGDVASARVAAVADLVKAADATTSVATLSYQFFTGKIPTAAGYDYLVSPTGPNPNNINAAYYQDFNLENRYINFAVNLGKLGEGKDAFAASYGSMSLFDATKAIYGRIFGATPTDAKVHALLDPTFNFNGQTITRADYFAIYGQDGVNGIGTKAAMVGWLMAEAEKADLGLYAKANAAFLTDLSDGATLNVDLIGVYGRPEYAFGG